MILYFSGTENSEYIANNLRKILVDDSIDLFHFIKNGENQTFESEKPFVLVCPTYSWRVPRFLSEYLQKCEFKGTRDIYVVMNYGDSFGNAIKYIKANTKKLGLNFKGLYGIKMPENYLMLFDLDSDETNRKIVESAKAEILKAGNNDESDSGVKDIAYGGIFAGTVAFLTNALRVMSDSASAWFSNGKAVFQLPMGFSLALVGAGYLIGIVGGLAMLFGTFLALALIHM